MYVYTISSQVHSTIFLYILCNGPDTPHRPRSVEFVRKPVLSVMGMLSLLGAHQVTATVSKGMLVFPCGIVGDGAKFQYRKFVLNSWF